MQHVQPFIARHRSGRRAKYLKSVQLGGCKTGDAKTTRGHRLPAKWVIHTVGPVWRGGDQGEPALLTACYRRAMEEAVRVGARTVAFPAISTGVYGYPKAAAATVAVATLRQALVAHPGAFDEVVLCGFSDDDQRIVQAELDAG